jgi:hypothetical protein
MLSRSRRVTLAGDFSRLSKSMVMHSGVPISS